MNILSLEHLTHSYTERKLFDDADFYLHEGDKVGVIGINGTGKSTLLKIMAGLETPDEGQVIQASNLMIHYLPQNPEFSEEDTVLQSVQNMVHHHANENELIAAKAMLTRLGITDFEQKTRELSGGQRKRLALVSVLITPCDVLILDEPTNHLDSEMADWLENKLQAFRGALVMVTHDRYFLDSVTNKIIELDKGKIYSYDEKYSGFLQRKAEREESVRASERKRQSILRKEIEWISRGARARSTKQKAHIQRYEALKNQKAPEVDEKLQLSSISSRMGKTTIEIENVSKAYGENTLIRDFSYIFLKHDRIGFVGKNGCGKTTIMRLINGLELADAGAYLFDGRVVDAAYLKDSAAAQKFHQRVGFVFQNADAQLFCATVGEEVAFGPAQMGLPADELERRVRDAMELFQVADLADVSPYQLSGGQKKRVALAAVVSMNPDILVLDEPTNGLDEDSCDIVVNFLLAYVAAGKTVLMSTHHQDLVRRLSARAIYIDRYHHVVEAPSPSYGTESGVTD